MDENLQILIGGFVKNKHPWKHVLFMDSVVLLLLVASNVLLLGISWLVVACCLYCLVVENQLGGRNSASIIWGGVLCTTP